MDDHKKIFLQHHNRLPFSFLKTATMRSSKGCRSFSQAHFHPWWNMHTQ